MMIKQLQIIKRSSTRRKVTHNRRTKRNKMTISVNLGIGMEVNGGGTYPKQKKNAIHHNIIVMRLVLEKEEKYAV